MSSLLEHCHTLGDLGLATASDLPEGGSSRRARDAALRRARAAPGLFRVAPPPTPEGRWLQDLALLVLRTQPGGVVAGPAAAALLGLDGYDHRSPLHVQVPHRQRPRWAGADSGAIARTRDPGEQDRAGPFPITSVERTLLDLGATTPPRARWPGDHHPLEPVELVELAVESALRRALTTVDALASAAARSARPGAATLRAVLARRPAGAPPTESHLETRAVQMMRAARLPDPQRQVEVHDREGAFIGRIDLAVGDVLIECDGRQTHDTPEAFGRDRFRWSRLQAEGYAVLVFTSDHIERQPARSSDLIRATIGSHRSSRT